MNILSVLTIIKYLFTVIGLALFVGAAFAFLHTKNFLEDALTADGTVIELVRSRSSSKNSSNNSYIYTPVVEFQMQDGSTIEFTSSAGSNPPKYTRGEVVEVFYHKSSPENAKINDFFSLWGWTFICTMLGVAFSLVGLSMLLVGFLRGRKIAWLKENGMPIKAKFQRVGINRGVKVNGRSPYVVYAQWHNPYTNKVHVFRSENISFDPTKQLNTDEITVLIEKDNPKNYYVDLSFLPEYER